MRFIFGKPRSNRSSDCGFEVYWAPTKQNNRVSAVGFDICRLSKEISYFTFYKG